MSYNDCIHKTELAAQGVAATVVAAQSLNSFVGLEDDAKALPSVSFIGESSEPVTEGDLCANRFVTLAILVRTNRDDHTAAQHRGYVQAVFDVFYDDTLTTLLSAALVDFYCFTAEALGETQNTVDRSHETTARFRLMVCPSDLT